jgi:hypothetical protein
MERRLFFTAPSGFRDSDRWSRLACSLKTAVEESCGGDVSVSIGTRPVCGSGRDLVETLQGIGEQKLGARDVRVDPWCSYMFYETICITLGPGVRDPESRALTGRLSRQELAGETLLRDHEGSYGLDSGWVFGYELFARDDRARSTIIQLLESFPDRVYLGEDWLTRDEDGRIDEAIEVIASGLRVADSSVEGALDEHLALFRAPDSVAEARAWTRATASGQGLIALAADDPAVEALVRRFMELDDLPILLAEAPSTTMRVTIGRCHDDDSLVLVYGPPGALEVDDPLLIVL